MPPTSGSQPYQLVPKAGDVPLNLKRRAVSGGALTAGGQALRFLLTLGSTAVLARLLTPVEFGLVAMVTTLTGFLSLFKDAGLSAATVQRAEITHAQVSNLFWVNLGLGAALALAVALLAPALAWFYREPGIVGLTVALSGTFLLGGMVVQHQALLNRDLRFGAVVGIGVGSQVAGIVVGIAMASRGWGAWALVGQQMAAALAEAGFTWVLCPWRPQRPSSGSGAVGMLAFGGSLTAASLLRRIASRADTLLLGRFAGAEAVGLYSRGTVLLMRPLEDLLVPFYSVFIPVLSRLQSDPRRLREVFVQIHTTLVVLCFLCGAFALGLARPLVLVVLGPKWESVVPIFAACSFAALYLPQVAPANWLLTTQGRGRDYLILGVVGSTVTLVASIIGTRFGAIGVALALSLLGLVVTVPVTYHVVGRSGAVGSWDLWKTGLRCLPLWGIVAGCGYLTTASLAGHTPLLQLCVGIPACGLTATLTVAVDRGLRRDLLGIYDLARSAMHR